MRVIDKADNGGTVDVEIGKSFGIALYESPTTGYRWNLTSSGEPALRVTGDTFDTSQDKLGAGGMRQWTFTADRPAVVKLQFENKRAWETQAAEVFTVTIDVKVS